MNGYRYARMVGILWVLLAAWMAAVSVAQTAVVEVPEVPAEIRQMLQDRQYAESVEAIDRAMDGQVAEQDLLAYLKGRALFHQGNHDEAVAVFQALDQKLPDSQLARRARFAAGVALARNGDFQGAEGIYRREAEVLFSDQRRQEMADIYLEFADDFFDPPHDKTAAATDVEPDYVQALEFYLQAAEMGLLPDKRAAVALRIARCRQQLGKTPDAISDYERFLQDYPNDALAVEAGFRLGECHLADNRAASARHAWQDLLAAHGDADSPWIAEVHYRLASTWGLPKPDSDAELNLGVAALEAFLERFPEHKLAGQAQLDMANSFVHRERFDDAIACLTRLLGDERYADCEQIPAARDLLGTAYRLQKKFDLALAAWREYLQKHPSDAGWSKVQRRVIDAEHEMGKEAYRTGDFDAARQSLGEFLVKYPLDARNPGILYLFGQMDYERKQWDAAIAAWRRLVSKYPKTSESSEAQYMIGVTFERDLGRPADALEEYKHVTWGGRAGDAKLAVARLTDESLGVITPRVYRSNETPTLKLTTRNVPQVTVRVYRVGMEAYFRKMHVAGEIENLDIGLIDPNSTFEFTVPDYAEHIELESGLPVPLPGDAKVGTMAVTVSSDKLTATTLVIQSDLEIVVKSSQQEAFVFAQNMLTGEPWPGANLLLSNGERMLAEVATGDDGVYQGQIGLLKDQDRLRVLALAGGHIASNSLGVEPYAAAASISERGYLYTDRPAYRAGQQVRVRGCIRSSNGIEYLTSSGSLFLLSIFDPRSRLVWEQEVRLSKFGTFSAEFPLPAAAPQGEYRIVAVEQREHAFGNYQGTFTVEQYKLEPVRLTVDTDRRVYYRGEMIEGTIRASFYHGSPVAGREIKYSLADGRQITGTTDAAGELHFSLPTREFYESGTLTLKATLSDWSVTEAVNFYLATQGFSIEVATPRAVMLAGETFEVSVSTTDAAGEPIAEKLSLKVLELMHEDGQLVERLVQETELETAADGWGRKTLKLPEGSRYRIRAEGLDRWSNPVSGQTELTVSDDSDRVRLRILANRHTYKVGDQPQVTVHWRDDPALALVTFQAQRILEYRLLPLNTGANKLPIDMTAALSPNFDLAVTVMTDTRPEPKSDDPVVRFHQASAPFTVEQELKVTLALPDRGVATPGVPLPVTVTTTDVQGRPVSAELSLALVEQALLHRFDWPVEPIQDYFRPLLRESTVQTASSIDFRYEPVTTGINRSVLAEQARQQLAEQEAASRQRFIPGGMGMGGMGGMGGGFGGFGAGGGYYGEPEVEDTADFDSLLKLIEGSTVDFSGPFDDRGGEGPFDTNLSLVVRQAWEDLGASSPSSDAGVVQPPEETGYWNPAVITDETGQATIEIPLPDRTTAWTLMAKGITIDTLAGEATLDVIARKPVFADLKLPSAFTVGDTAEIIASLHCETPVKDPVRVDLRVDIGKRTVVQTMKMLDAGKGVTELPFQVDLTDAAGEADQDPAAEVVFQLTVSSGELQDVVQRVVPLLPYGMTIYATAGGTAEADATAWVEPPALMPFERPKLQILVGPSVERSLLDAVLAPATLPVCGSPWGSATESAASDLLASLALQEMLQAASPDDPQLTALDLRIRAALGSLLAAQNETDGWDWTGAGESADRYTTARVVWAISAAKQAGYPIADPVHALALKALREHAARIAANDYESKAVLLHSLAVAGESDFTLANRLYRERSALSVAAQLYLALAFVEMDRKELAGDLLSTLTADQLDVQGGVSSLPWSDSPAELRALYVLASQAVTPAAPQAQAAVDWLMAHRAGNRWSPDKATGPAVAALCQWFASRRVESQRYRLTVRVNEHELATLQLDASQPSHTIDVPAAMLVDGKQRVQFQINGRGRYSYQAVLSGHVPAEQLASTTNAWEVNRVYTPAPWERDGREVPRGFDIVTDQGKAFLNPLNQLPVGQRGIVQLSIRRAAVDAVPDQQLQYLVVQEPIPGGAAVVQDSVTGDFERFEIQPGRIIFYVGNRRTVGTIRYELRGYSPGSYRTSPTVVRNMHRPEQIAVAQPKSLTVLPSGTPSNDPYRLSPDELYHLGVRAAERGEWAEAESMLTKLTEEWSLKPAIHLQVVKRLLDTHLALNQPQPAVRCFEIMHERWPDEVISFETLLQIGAAYQAIGEFERAHMVYRGVVEGNFTRESGVAGTLAAKQEFLRSVRLMNRLLREYPPEAYVAAAEVSLAQEIFAKAPSAADDERLRKAEVNRIDLLIAAWQMLEAMLTEYPEAPAADQASFSAANALLEMEKFEEAAAACERYAERFADSDLLDSYWFIIGYSRFALGQHEAASGMFDKVVQQGKGGTGPPATDPFGAASPQPQADPFGSGPSPQAAPTGGRAGDVDDPFAAPSPDNDPFGGNSDDDDDPFGNASPQPQTPRTPAVTKRTTESPNKWPAIYLLGQIHHSLGQPAEAITKYRQVEDRYPDAKRSIDYFLHKDIELPELTTIRPGQPTEVHLEYRNIPSCDVKVYRIDLMKFALLRQNLGGVAEINLAGVEPQHQVTVELGEGRDYRDCSRTLPLPLHEDGAYLVVCRGESLFASGLVLLSPLQLEIQFDASDSLVRATVKDTTDDSYVYEAEVKIIGSGNSDFVSGKSDRRGVFTGQNIVGFPTVIARAGDGRFAFYRDPAASSVGQMPLEVSSRLPAILQGGALAALSDVDRATGIVLSGPGASPAEQRIDRALDGITNLKFVETPLKEVVATIARQHGIPVELDVRALDDVGIGVDAPITRELRGISLRSALKLLLRDLDLTFHTDLECLMITTPEEAESQLATVVYPVTDLVAFKDSAGKRWSDYDTLIQTITSTIAPTSWDIVGGPGAIEGLPYRDKDVLILSQTQDVHRQIAALLQKMRTIAGSEGPNAELPVRDEAEFSSHGAPFGGYGGMGGYGFGGGMGGYGGGFGDANGERPFVTSVIPAVEPSAAGPGPGLLKGLQDTQQRLQGRSMDQLQRMYKQGMGGMGGMGGGFF